MDTDVGIAEVATIGTNVILKMNIVRHYLQRTCIRFEAVKKCTNFRLEIKTIKKQ